MNQPSANSSPSVRVVASHRIDRLETPEITLDRVRAAQSAWSETSIGYRLNVVRRFREQCAEAPLDLLAATHRKQERPAREGLMAELLPLVEACRFLERTAIAILAPTRLRRGRPLWLMGTATEVRREPCGVVLIIAPSNYPLLLPGVQVLQALVAGNAVLLKPGLNGTQAGLAIASLLARAGLPEGLLTVLDESAETSRKTLEMQIDKVLFTGSSAVGTSVLASLAPRAIPSTMELSGSDAVLVCGDADLDLTVRALVFGLTLNAGQTCIAPRRVFVVRSVATEFEGRLAQAFAVVPPAPLASQEGARLGPVVDEALKSGAHFVSGRVLKDGSLEGPVVLGGVRHDSRLLQEDIFSQVMTVVTVDDSQEALEFAANSRYALGATIFSRNIDEARELAERINAGVVVINDVIVPTADPRVPFGGRKLSGFGVTRGREGLLDLTVPKVISVRRGTRRPHYEPVREIDANMFSSLICLLHGRGLRRRTAAAMQVFRDALVRRKQTNAK